MEWINKQNVLIVGLGLIGGSYARALKRIGCRVTALDRSEKTLGFALENGIIDDGATSVTDSENKDKTIRLINEADCIILALYPNAAIEWIKDNVGNIKEGIMITDVTGVKSCIVYEIQKILQDKAEFIAAHPMAGKETSGVEYSDDRIFRDANYIVVPTDRNTEEAICWCENLGQILGFNKVSVLSPEEHDEMIAYVSQLTHCIAVSLMTCKDNEHLKDYTGDSFRDLTRIARINENMWSELFHMNKEPLLKEMNLFIDELTELRDLIEADDTEAIKAKMRLSTERRAKFNSSKR
ncbi:MAG: prephenate dehydrogenase [Lachnospiraceae bacterium]|nr:prephenate dehydrogenase [Lachnospiraceae bacterium]